MGFVYWGVVVTHLRCRLQGCRGWWPWSRSGAAGAAGEKGGRASGLPRTASWAGPTAGVTGTPQARGTVQSAHTALEMCPNGMVCKHTNGSFSERLHAPPTSPHNTLPAIWSENTVYTGRKKGVNDVISLLFNHSSGTVNPFRGQQSDVESGVTDQGNLF